MDIVALLQKVKQIKNFVDMMTKQYTNLRKIYQQIELAP